MKTLKEVSFPLNKDGTINWKDKTDEIELFKTAKKDFKRTIKASSKEEISNAITGYGISACNFAMKYTSPEKNPELYKKIYNIYYSYFKGRQYIN